MTPFDPSELRKQYALHSRAEYEAILLSVVHDIRTALASTNLRFQIKYRVKSFDEYLKKLCIGQDGRPTAERVEDIMGIRIVCPFLGDLEELETKLSERFEITEVDKKQHGQSFREFGYDATHLLLAPPMEDIAHPLPHVPVVCEIQLRTILQDAWAEVEHELIYKSEWPIPTFQIRRKLAALNANLTLGDIIFQELRDFQREMLRKQNKRRSLADESLEMLSKNEIHTKLFEGDDARDSLEKIIIDALSAHAEESFDTAIALYSRALEMQGVESVRAILHNHRGMAYLAIGDIDAAHDDFQSAIAFDRDNYRAWYNLATVRKSLGKFGGAIEAFETCLRLNPSFTEARAKQIYLFLDSRDLKNAEAALIEMRRYSPDSPELPLLEAAVARYRTA